MPGFSNDTMYAHNVDFTGSTHVQPQVTTDGQLLIGSTASPNIRVGSLASSDSSLTITPGSGTINLSALGVPEHQILYVGKQGNDAQTGTTIGRAFLTFGAAITAATAAIPSAVNRYVIVCFDDGIYAEAISLPSYVDLYAPNATITGTLTVNDSVNVKLFTLNAATGTTAITKPAGSTYSNVEIEIINCAGTANGCTLSTGFLNLTWKELYVVDGYGIGDISVGLGHIHIKGGDIYISGTGIGLIRANTGSTVGHVDHILDIGGGTGSAIIVYDGTIDVVVNKIEVSNAYNVQGATSVLNLFCNELIGTQLFSLGGTPNVTTNTFIMQPNTNSSGTTGVYSLGNNRFLHNYGSQNTFAGESSGNLSLTGSQNTFCGYHSGISLTSGSYNSVLGAAGQSLTTGNANLILGDGSGSSYTSSESFNVCVAHTGVTGDSHVMRLGFDSHLGGQVSSAYIAGVIGTNVSNTEMVTIDSTTGQLGVQSLSNLTTWSEITSNQTASIGHGYFCNKAGTLALALPATSAVGDVIEVANINTATGVQFTQAAGQQIFIGPSNTTLGATGTLTSSAVGDCLMIVCRTANTIWQVVSMVGNWTPA